MSTYTATTDQLGIGITKSVLGWKYPASGVKAPNGGDLGTNNAANAAIDQGGMPFMFVIGNQQILLPPVLTTGNSSVPPLPDGLTVVYAASFMGVDIPSDMIRPVCAGGQLQFSGVEMQSAQGMYPILSGRAGGSATNALLISNGITTGPNMGETLLRLLMATMECLIYSYSSNPWGNGYNDLSDACMTKRNYPNLLVYPYQKQTLLDNYISDVAPIYTKYLAPIANLAGTAVGVPGLGSLTASALNTAKGVLTTTQKQNVNTALTTSAIPTDSTLVDSSGNVLQSASSSISGSGNTLLLLLLAVVAVVVIIILAS